MNEHPEPQKPSDGIELPTFQPSDPMSYSERYLDNFRRLYDVVTRKNHRSIITGASYKLPKD